ncbi:MAG: hypothetical protein PHI34_09705 [Acidobacteriota bacterium]|nr:hypothetical protein [Acidobacteriota bacterium]
MDLGDTTILIFLPALLFSLIALAKAKNTYAKYARVAAASSACSSSAIREIDPGPQ